MSKRKKLLFWGSVAARAGYGDHARDLVNSLFEMDKYDIQIVSTNWGNCPLDALNSNDEKDKRILDSLLVTDLKEQPDIFIQCTVPNEFKRLGKYNIGITAGIETNTCSAEWIDGLNRMDRIIVPSKHSRDVFLNTQYEKRDNRTHQVVHNLKCEREIDVLFEGLDLEVFKKTSKLHKTINDTLNSIDEKFCFLFVGHWIRGGFKQDRKDISGMIHTFLNTFKGVKNKPALILKTSGATFSIRDREEILNKIQNIRKMVDGDDLPNIYLIHGDLTKGEVNSLYNHPKVKSMVSFTKGEGFGRPLLEFLVTGKPLITTNWSGHIDFINPNESVLLDGELQQIHQSAVWENVLIPESKWFTVDYDKASKSLSDVFNKYVTYKNKAKSSSKRVKENYSLSEMKKQFEMIMTDLDNDTIEIENNIPKLERV